LLLGVGALADTLNERGHQLRPLIAGYLDRGDGGNELCGSRAYILVWCGQSTQSHVLDLLLDLGIEVEPSFLDLT
jgi:hypothetical protein